MSFGPTKCCHHYRPILYYSHQLDQWPNKNPDAWICMAHACGNRPKERLTLWPGHHIYYMVDIDNLNFDTNLIKGHWPKGRLFSYIGPKF